MEEIMYSILITVLLTVLFVIFDGIESRWEERRREHDQLGVGSADSVNNSSDNHVYRRSRRTN